ncbi:MAG: biotin--[acetyl-CoA-carboxylase] ligase [Clostridia bacterium]|nr:biotin--[acetyl-CoA-carboxylase] ligase [Clostridia bacterium]
MTGSAAWPVRGFVALGSNLGRRCDYLASARAALGAAGVTVLAASRVYESPAEGVPGAQPPFLNAVLAVAFPGSPEELLALCLAVEAAHGRERGEARAAGGPGPRTLDLDLLLAQDAAGRPIARAGASLRLPHPRAAGRAFVRLPLAEVAGAIPGLAETLGPPPDDPAYREACGRTRARGPLALWPDDAYRDDTVTARFEPGSFGLGSAFRFLAETGSTNDDARLWAAEGAPHGALVVADRQTAGRGRLGRAWATPPGVALALSAVLRPGWPPERLALLPFAAGLAVARALEDLGLRPGLKWPNDVLVNGRKLSGILAEVTRDAVVLGIGVNLNWPRGRMEPELYARATSVLAERGGPVSRPLFLLRLLRELDRALQELDASPEGVLCEWRRRSTTLGREVRVRAGGEILEGVAREIRPDGGLLLAARTGERVVHAGDVTVL